MFLYQRRRRRSVTAAASFTPFTAGFNFRKDNTTAGYVDIEGVNEVYVLPTDAYTGSVIRGGLKFGFTNSLSLQDGRDRSTTVDRRLAGIAINSGVAPVFRVDLPSAGTYDIRLAAGDAGNPATVSATVLDGATSRIAVGPTAVSAGHFIDAVGTDLTAAAWPGSNAAVSITMTGTILNVTWPTASKPFCHLNVTRTA